MSRSGEFVDEESRNNSNGRVLVETRSGEVVNRKGLSLWISLHLGHGRNTSHWISLHLGHGRTTSLWISLHLGQGRTMSLLAF